MFDQILQERLGTRLALSLYTPASVWNLSHCSADMTNSEDQVSAPIDEIPFTQSCDLDLHQPAESESNNEFVAVDNQEVMVDEEAIKQSMELSQRISNVTTGESHMHKWLSVGLG